jgi:hypothetical protein
VGQGESRVSVEFIFSFLFFLIFGVTSTDAPAQTVATHLLTLKN